MWDTAVAAVSQSATAADGDTYGGKQIARSSLAMGDVIKPQMEIDKQDIIADIAIEITKIIEKHSRVDGRITQAFMVKLQQILTICFMPMSVRE